MSDRSWSICLILLLTASLLALPSITVVGEAETGYDPSFEIELEQDVRSLFAEGDILYTSSSDGSVFAHDIEDGDEIWRHEEHRGPALTVFYSEGVLYSGGQSGSIVAYDAEEEEKIWRHEKHSGAVNSVFYQDGILYSGGDDGHLIAFDMEEESVLWQHEKHEQKVGSVFYDDGIVYSGGSERGTGIVSAFDVKEREEIWRYENHDVSVNSLFFEDGNLYSSGHDGTVLAFDVEEREIHWEHEEHDGPVDTIFLEDEVIYSGGKDNSIVAYHIVEEEKLWRLEYHDDDVRSVFYHQDTLFSGGAEGSLIGLRDLDIEVDITSSMMIVSDEDSRLMLEYTAENPGDLEARLDFEVLVDGETVRNEEDIRIGPRDTRDLSLAVEVEEEEEHDIELKGMDTTLQTTHDATVSTTETVYAEGDPAEEGLGLHWWITLLVILVMATILAFLLLQVGFRERKDERKKLMVLKEKNKIPAKKDAPGKDLPVEKLEEKREEKERLKEEIETLKKEKDRMEKNTAQYFHQISKMKEKKDALEEEIEYLEKDDQKGQTEEDDLPEEEKTVDRNTALEELSQVKGVGESKAEKLYEHGYRSIKDLRDASKEELCEVNGIGPSLSQMILESLDDE